MAILHFTNWLYNRALSSFGKLRMTKPYSIKVASNFKFSFFLIHFLPAYKSLYHFYL